MVESSSAASFQRLHPTDARRKLTSCTVRRMPGRYFQKCCQGSGSWYHASLSLKHPLSSLHFDLQADTRACWLMRTAGLSVDVPAVGGNIVRVISNCGTGALGVI